MKALSLENLRRELSLDAKLLNHAALTRSLPGQSPDLSNSSAAINLFASVAWSCITEPGDEFAGFVRRQLGAAASLSLLINCQAPRRWAFELLADDLADVADERFVSLEQTIQESLDRWRPRLSLSKVLSLLDAAERMNIRLITNADKHWPIGLANLGLAEPAMLWLRGSAECLSTSTQSAALVGSRTATEYGFEATASLVQGLADAGVAIVSGGAFGIDAIAHRAALTVETPTIAVMAGGIDRLYPRSNESLLRAIIDQGAVISEVAPGTSPTKWRFLQRNRIIAAMSCATVVVEAGYRSGAINTANHAIALNLAVGAVPGSIFSATSAGCNRLIADRKAQVVTSAKDVLELIRNNSETLNFNESGFMAHTSESLEQNPASNLAGVSAAQSSVVSNLLPLDLRVYDAIGFSSRTLDQICLSAGLTSNEALQALGSLTLLGLVSSNQGSWERA
jgi:DNA processing protein